MSEHSTRSRGLPSKIFVFLRTMTLSVSSNAWERSCADRTTVSEYEALDDEEDRYDHHRSVWPHQHDSERSADQMSDRPAENRDVSPEFALKKITARNYLIACYSISLRNVHECTSTRASSETEWGGVHGRDDT